MRDLMPSRQTLYHQAIPSLLNVLFLHEIEIIRLQRRMSRKTPNTLKFTYSLPRSMVMCKKPQPPLRSAMVYLQFAVLYIQVLTLLNIRIKKIIGSTWKA